MISDIPEVTCLSGRQICVDYGEQLTLECYVKAFPDITELSWVKFRKKYQQVVSTGTKRCREGCLQKTSMTIEKCVLRDAGRYRCIVSNALGTAQSQDMIVTVNGGILLHDQFHIKYYKIFILI